MEFIGTWTDSDAFLSFDGSECIKLYGPHLSKEDLLRYHAIQSCLAELWTQCISLDCPIPIWNRLIRSVSWNILPLPQDSDIFQYSGKKNSGEVYVGYTSHIPYVRWWVRILSSNIRTLGGLFPELDAWFITNLLAHTIRKEIAPYLGSDMEQGIRFANSMLQPANVRFVSFSEGTLHVTITDIAGSIMEALQQLDLDLIHERVKGKSNALLSA